VAELPQEFRDRLENVAIVVQDWPTRRQLTGMRKSSRFELLGLYQGVPHTARGENYNLALPDTITLFRRSILARCRSVEEVRQAVRDTLRHEIAHHFGSSEASLRQIERRWRRRR
ncbi:MAG: metallopeptidase family protein, partial [Chloroflexota bacterium]